MIKRIHSGLFKVKDLSRTAEFYRKLGFEVQESVDGVRLIFGDFRLAFIPDQEEVQKELVKGAGISVYFEVENVDEFYESAKGAGVEIIAQPVTQPWKKREVQVTDPDGHSLVFFQNVD